LLGLSYLLWAGASAAALILVVAARREHPLGRIGGSRVLQFFGKYSYGMYVFQLPLISILGGILTAQGIADAVGSAIGGQLIFCVMMFMATTAAAVMSWHVFEKRWLGLKRYFE
jgi:peptidoglycan/LPS O-acetylase OafA/YrhL